MEYNQAVMLAYVIPSAEAIAIEKAVLSSGASEESLMLKAGSRMYETFVECFPETCKVVVYLGTGNNAGDALVMAKFLAKKGYLLDLKLSHEKIEELRPLPSKYLQEFQSMKSSADELESSEVVIVDGMLGLFAKGQPRGVIAERIKEINRKKKDLHAKVVALDFPTGIDPLGQQGDWEVVKADYTLTVAFVKDVLLEHSLEKNVGKIIVIPIEEFSELNQNKNYLYVDRELVKSIYKPRKFDVHKYTAGQVGIFAGSEGFWGAARICSYSTIKSGAGLCTVFVDDENYFEVLKLFSPEIIVKKQMAIEKIDFSKVNALAIGPGWGVERSLQHIPFFAELKIPQVWDADMITALAMHKDRDSILKNLEHVVLTPHQGEFNRLIGNKIVYGCEALKQFEHLSNATLVLKGARTYIRSSRDSKTFVNSTGNAGMASGGMGDALTGLISSLLAQSYSAKDAAVLGAWLLGFSADQLVSNQESEETLIASDVINNFRHSFHELRG